MNSSFITSKPGFFYFICVVAVCVLCLLIMALFVGLQSVTVALPRHTHFFTTNKNTICWYHLLFIRTVSEICFVYVQYSKSRQL